MLAFIEGSMERQFINSNMKYIHVIPVDNGISWTLTRMCEQIVSAYLALDIQNTVIVWIDREGREETSEKIYEEILAALVHAGALCDDVHILINDRMSENVMLADEQMVQEEFNMPNYQYSYEGASGKSIIKAFYRQKGENYKETRQGIALLKKTRLSRSALKSPSVARLLHTLKFECWWI